MSTSRNPTGVVPTRLTRQELRSFQRNNAIHFVPRGSEFIQDAAYEVIGTLIHLLKTHSLRDILIDVNKVEHVQRHLDDMKLVGYSGQWMEGLYEHLQSAETAREIKETLLELDVKIEKSMLILPKQKAVLRYLEEEGMELVQEKEKLEMSLNQWDMKYEVGGNYSFAA